MYSLALIRFHFVPHNVVTRLSQSARQFTADNADVGSNNQHDEDDDNTNVFSSHPCTNTQIHQQNHLVLVVFVVHCVRFPHIFNQVFNKPVAVCH